MAHLKLNCHVYKSDSCLEKVLTMQCVVDIFEYPFTFLPSQFLSWTLIDYGIRSAQRAQFL